MIVDVKLIWNNTWKALYKYIWLVESLTLDRLAITRVINVKTDGAAESVICERP